MLRFFGIVFALMVMFAPGQARADCTLPAGTPGSIFYNQTEKIFQYCSDNVWKRMNEKPGTGTGGCTLPTLAEGQMAFNADHRVLQGCAGNVHRIMGHTEGRLDWKQISVGVYHVCAIKEDDTLHCWGGNAQGQLGDGTTTDRLTQTPVSGGGTWKSVDTGYSHTCGIKSDDTLWCWGENDYGQIGDNTSGTNRLIPTAISGGGRWKQVNTGLYYSCGIKSDDTLHCWGRNTDGRTGQNTTTGNTLVPAGISGGGIWKRVGTGDSDACGIKSDDTLWCWGNNFRGQVGDGTTSQRSVPTAVSGGGSWKFAMLGYNHSCGIKSDDTLWCWGNNNSGRTGLGTSSGSTLVPTQISGGGTWKRVDAAQYNGAFSCGVKSDDTLWCWGSNNLGQLGDPAKPFGTTVPNPVAAGGTWKDVKVAQYTSCGLKTDNSIRCWGSNNFGILGDGTSDRVFTPMPISGNAYWQMIARGVSSFGSATCGIKADNHLWCWGNNQYGMLGDGTYTTPDQPVEVSGGSVWKKVAVSGNHTCGIMADDTLWCWGGNFSGELGTGGGGTAVPAAVSGGGTWKEVAAGGNAHSCAIKSNDSLWCWGRNNWGQLGDNSSTPRVTPVPIAVGETWKQIDTGDSSSSTHTCGIKLNDTLWCWGGNASGEVGDGSTTQRLIPAAISGGGAWKQVSAGDSSSCGIKNDGTLWCWGNNASGQGGDGTTTSPRNTPTPISGGGSWKYVSAGANYACGIKSDDTLWCWGSNGVGQLGDGTTIQRLVPTAVSGGGIWVQVVAGNGATCAVSKTDNATWCWGSNYEKQLTVTPTSAPYRTSGVTTACSAPTKPAGVLLYNADLKLLQYCDGVGWAGIAGGTPPPPGPEGIPTLGLYSYWPMNENTGTGVADVIGNGLNGTAANTTWVPGGKLGSALDFNGTTSVVTTSAVPWVNNMARFSISAWIYPRSLGEGNHGRIIGKSAGTDISSFGWMLNMTNDVSNSLTFTMDFNSSHLSIVSSANAYSLNSWTHVALTWDGTPAGTSVKLYINGYEATTSYSASGSGARADDSANIVMIGNNPANSRTFDGYLDEVRIYNRVLSAAEIRALAGQ